MTKVIGYSLESVDAAIYQDKAGLYVFTAQDHKDLWHPKVERVTETYEEARNLLEGFIARQRQ